MGEPTLVINMGVTLPLVLSENEDFKDNSAHIFLNVFQVLEVVAVAKSAE